MTDHELHVGFTGTRRGMTLRKKAAVREHFDNNDHIVYLHHGDCIGADAEAHAEALYFGIRIWTHPPKDQKYRARVSSVMHQEPLKTYLKRNHDIVDSTTYLIATPSGFTEVRRSGTWATVRYARKQGKEVVIIYLDGKEVHDP